MDMDMKAVKEEADYWRQEAQSLADKVRAHLVVLRITNCILKRLHLIPHHLSAQVSRLEPLIEWEHTARTELEALKVKSESERALLDLAVSERTALLRENDKIIVHYRQEAFGINERMKMSLFMTDMPSV
jgi:hypothetical protein